MGHIEFLDEMPENAYRLGRHVDHDDRSWNYNVTPTVRSRLCATLTRAGLVRNRNYWRRFSPILDQGALGSCTGHAMTALLGCEPFATSEEQAEPFDENFAVELYSEATRVDQFQGEYPPEDTGSSGLAVAKVAKEWGFIRQYRWAFTTNSLIYALRFGPVIVGAPWYEEMFTPDRDGYVFPTGDVVGGHEFLIRGYSKGTFLADNSWGANWGLNGSFNFTVATWEVLRKNGADVTVPKR